MRVGLRSAMCVAIALLVVGGLAGRFAASEPSPSVRSETPKVPSTRASRGDSTSHYVVTLDPGRFLADPGANPVGPPSPSLPVIFEPAEPRVLSAAELQAIEGLQELAPTKDGEIVAVVEGVPRPEEAPPLAVVDPATVIVVLSSRHQMRNVRYLEGNSFVITTSKTRAEVKSIEGVLTVEAAPPELLAAAN